MTILNKPIAPDGVILRGLILNSKDLFSKESYEERIDAELAMLMVKYPQGSMVNLEGVKDITLAVERFIAIVSAIIKDLGEIKVKAEQEEIRKIDDLRKLFEYGTKINARNLKKELENFAKSIKGSTISALRSNLRAEKRLSRGKAPLGYILKKVRQDTSLDAEIAKKAYRIGEHTAEEHALYYRAIDLINSLRQNPSKEKLEQLRQLAEALMKSYEQSLEDFLNIEIDIKIEEARKLHRIDHYITFLKSLRYSSNANSAKNIAPLIEKLNALKTRAENWVYQDTINAKKLQQYAIASLQYGENLLKTSQIDLGDEFPGIVMETHSALGEIPGILIFNKNKPLPNRGIVLVHGAFGSKETLSILGKRLASQDFLVYTIDIPQHGENIDLFRLGAVSDHILKAVSFLRAKGVGNVGVVGHSLGGYMHSFCNDGV